MSQKPNQPISSAPASTALTETQLASRWNINPKTLQAWRLLGKGPSYTKIGKAIRYLPEVVNANEQQNTETSTSA